MAAEGVAEDCCECAAALAGDADEMNHDARNTTVSTDMLDCAASRGVASNTAPALTTTRRIGVRRTMATATISALIYYVYALFDYRGDVFYIGKGKGKRWNWHLSDCNLKAPTYKNNIIKKTKRLLGSVPRVKIAEGLSEGDAHAMEVALIKAIGRFPDGPLVNATDGGEGNSGRPTVHSVETRAKISASHVGKSRGPMPAETRAKISIANSNPSPELRAFRSAMSKGKTVSEETREKIRIARANQIITEETKRKLSIAITGRQFSAISLQKMSVAQTGHSVSQETRDKISATLAGRKRSPHSEETKRKIAAGNRKPKPRKRTTRQFTLPGLLEGEG